MADKLQVGDCTLRDGQQSLYATRFHLEDIVPIAAEIDKVGYYAVDVSADFLFEISIRFLNEDPWERIRLLKKLMPHTPVRMAMRGRTLAGWRNYPDDVVTAFFTHACECGVDIFRLYDTLNEERNFETCTRVIKKHDKKIQAEIIYALTEEKLGGPVYNLDYYVNKALTLQKMGADSVCITDAPGILAPEDAYQLVKAFKRALDIPMVLHCHYISGMASMSYLRAIEAGVDIIDTCLAPLALRVSLPAVEPFVLALKGMPRDTGLDLNQLHKVGQYFESILPRYREFLDTSRTTPIDTGILLHQMPGGMTATLLTHLKEVGAVDRMAEVRVEVARVRRELGYPPLATPLAQVVATLAVQNILVGRYKMISRQLVDYVCGMYGRSPAPIDPEVEKIVLKGLKPEARPSPSAKIEPELDKVKEATKNIAKNVGDVLLVALYPTYGMQFLRRKYGLEAASSA